MSKAREEWMKANKEKVAEYKKKYRDNNRQKCKDASRAWREANKEKESAYRKSYYQTNKEREKEYRKEYLKVWNKNNKHKVYVYNANRRALQFRATIYLTATDKKEIDNLYKLAQDKTKETGEVWHVDHIIPLTKGGLHKPTNLQVVPARWNLSKGNRTEEKYNGYY